MGIAAFFAVFAKAAMSEKGQLCLADMLTCQYSGQNQIQNRNPMIKAAGRYPKQWNIADISQQKHGPGEDGSAVMHLGSPGRTRRSSSQSTGNGKTCPNGRASPSPGLAFP